MLLSLNWLQRYVDVGDLEPRRIADELTLATAEIEDVRSFGGELARIVVGEVVEHGRHPNADKLSLCRVDVGGPELLSIVCGAPNVAQGQKVAVVRAGERLPDGTKIKKGKIRGEVSEGMICSERELGLSDEHEGILVLDPAAPVGRPLTEALPVEDVLFEIDNKSITHRPDLWGHYGFARELAAAFDRPLKPFDEGLRADIPGTGRSVPVSVESGDCPLYLGLVVDGVEIGPAPAWMRYLLVAVGQRPINNVVDLTNFLLLDLGQPMHAFDLARLRGPAVTVRGAEAGETIRTLDGQERALEAGDLLICDAGGPVALAGIMGGEGSMVAAGTRAVFLESANFDPVRVRRTAARLGLRTESAARFEKSLDPCFAEAAARKFVGLLAETCPEAHAAGPITRAGSWRPSKTVVPLRLARASAVLGVEVDEARARSLLEPLGFELRAEAPGRFAVTVPSFRATKDVTLEVDLIEELGRRLRYGSIPEEAPRRAAEVPYRDPELWSLRRIKTILAQDCGYHEAYNYSFVDDELVERLELSGLPWLRVENAIASHLSRVRRDVLPGLLASAARNLRARPRVALFEAGKGYRPERRGERLARPGAEPQSLPEEVHQVAGVLACTDLPEDEVLGRVRGHIEHLFRRLERRGLEADRPAEVDPWLHPGKAAGFYDPEDRGNPPVAVVAAVHPGALAALGVEVAPERAGAAAFVLDLRRLLRVPERPAPYRPAPRFPPQPVDLALLVDRRVRVAELEDLLRRAEPKLVREVRLFEVYRGAGLPAGKKSCNFTVVLGSEKRTLTQKDEERYIERVRALAAEAGHELRG